MAKQNIASIAKLLNAEQWKGVIAFNEFALQSEAVEPTPWGKTGPWTSIDDLRLTAGLQDQGIDVPISAVGRAVNLVAHDNRFHPVRDYLKLLKWDGKERIDNWLSTYFGADRNQYTCAVGPRWLMSAVARIFQPGAKVDTMLILEGNQGIGKSEALRILAGQEWFTDHLPDLGSKDAFLQLHGTWILEIAELEALNRADTAAIKKFLSGSVDKFRLPYGSRSEQFSRQCVFVGTTNAQTYLKDETGNRRFWPVRCQKADWDALKADRDQLWAEAVARFKQGGKWWLDTPELEALAEEEHASRKFLDPWEVFLTAWLSNRTDTSVDEVLIKALKKSKGSCTRQDDMRIAAILKGLGWERYRAYKGGKRPWRYRRGPELLLSEVAA